MRKYILGILCSLTIQCYANKIAVFSIHNGRAHMSWTTSYSSHYFETGQKGEILIELIQALLKEKKYTDKHIFINYPSFWKEKKSYTKISCEEKTYIIYNDKSEKEYTENGVVFEIHDLDVNIKEVLSLVNHTIDSITKSKTDTAIVNKILQQRVYRNKTKTKSLYEIDYYFENGKFYFYYLDKPYDEKDITQKNVLVINNVLEIVGKNEREGYLVFVNDSIFHFLHDGEASEPLLFKWRLPSDSSLRRRSPITKYEVEYRYEKEDHWYSKWFYLHYNLDYKKALFIPKFNFVEANYQELEAQFVKTLTKPTPKVEEEPKSGNLYYILLSFFLCISILLNIIYLRKK